MIAADRRFFAGLLVFSAAVLVLGAWAFLQAGTGLYLGYSAIAAMAGAVAFDRSPAILFGLVGVVLLAVAPMVLISVYAALN